MERLMRGYSRVAHFTRDMPYTVADRLEERARDSSDKPFIIFEDQTISFGEMNERANRVVHAALAAGLKRGDVVALLMNNRPEFVMIWLGLSKAGIVTALLNTSATGPVLIHALEQVNARGLIFGAELSASVEAVERSALPQFLFCQNETGTHDIRPHDAVDFNIAMTNADPTDPDPALRDGIVMQDPSIWSSPRGRPACPKPRT